MIQAVADTHAIIWYLYDDPRLSITASATIEATNQTGNEIAISSISLVEIAYLIEKGRIAADAFDLVTGALNNADAFLRELPVNQDVAQTMRRIDRAQVSDMPDRIVAATALILNVPIISRDGRIQTSVVATIW